MTAQEFAAQFSVTSPPGVDPIAFVRNGIPISGRHFVYVCRAEGQEADEVIKHVRPAVPQWVEPK